MSDLQSHVAPIPGLSSRARLEKSLNSLLGIIEGISIDRAINEVELRFLSNWLDEHADVASRHPYNELIPPIQAALEDGKLTEEERSDIKWLCEKLRSMEFIDAATADLQRLRAIVVGIASDGQINEMEVRELSEWLQQHERLKTCWPYDELDSLVTIVLGDGKIDATEHEALKSYFSGFTDNLNDSTGNFPLLKENQSIMGVCAISPDVRFADSIFRFAGASAKFSHPEFSELVARLGGRCVHEVSANVDYLVVGADGNPCWAYACYGRAIDEAVKLRKAGARLVVVHENDFHDAVADQR